MGLLDNFMPGESSGMPMQQGLLDNPMLQIGLGILANNNSKNFGQVIGRGALQGIGNIQQAQQLAQQRKMQEYQVKDYERKQAEYDRQQKALEAFKLKFPEYGEAVELDPKLAIKAAYPNLASNSADPYYTPIATEQGLGSFNNRSGKFELVQGPNGQTVVKSTDSPLVRGAVSQAEASGTAAYKVDNSIPGVVSTAKQVSEMANPALTQLPVPVNGRIPAQPMPTNNFNTPYAVTFGAPGTTATDLAEGTMTDASVAVRNPSRPNVQGSYAPTVSGIKVPTPAEQAAMTESAKLKAENVTKTQLDLPTTIANAQMASKQVDELIGSRDGRIKPHAGFDAAVGASSKFDPRNYLPGTDATGFNTRLDQLKGGIFLQAFNSLRGGGAITEKEGEKATSAIARMNTATSEDEFRIAARDYQDVIDAGLKRQMQKAGVSGNTTANPAAPQAMALPAKPSALTLKKGMVYATPKGNLTWNGKAFED